MSIGIYKITNPMGKIYIGQSINIEKRFKRYNKLYNYDIKCQPLLFNSFLKYGCKNHYFEIIEECNIIDLNKRERYWQKYYNVLEEGLNLQLTSTKDRSGEFSNKHKNNISKSKIGSRYNIDKNRIHGNYGSTRSEETLKKMSLAKKGRSSSTKKHKEILSKTHKGKIISDDVKEKMSISHKKLKKKLTKEHKNILSKVNKGNKNLKGYKYTDQQKENISKSKSKNIICVNNNKEYRNIRFASEELDISPTLINSVLKGKREYAKGYKFKYA